MAVSPSELATIFNELEDVVP